MKLMYYMRVSKSFSSLVKLINAVLSTVGPFTVFLVMWMIALCMLYKVSGFTLTVGSSDYPNININFALFIQNFRNSLANIAPPQNDYWFPPELNKTKALLDAKNDIVDQNWIQFLMNSWGWILFMTSEHQHAGENWLPIPASAGHTGNRPPACLVPLQGGRKSFVS